MKLRLTETLVAEKPVDVPDEVVKKGFSAVFDWIIAHDKWPEFKHIVDHDYDYEEDELGDMV